MSEEGNHQGSTFEKGTHGPCPEAFTGLLFFILMTFFFHSHFFFFFFLTSPTKLARSGSSILLGSNHSFLFKHTDLVSALKPDSLPPHRIHLGSFLSNLPSLPPKLYQPDSFFTEPSASTWTYLLVEALPESPD